MKFQKHLLAIVAMGLFATSAQATQFEVGISNTLLTTTRVFGVEGVNIGVSFSSGDASRATRSMARYHNKIALPYARNGKRTLSLRLGYTYKFARVWGEIQDQGKGSYTTTGFDLSVPIRAPFVLTAGGSVAKGKGGEIITHLDRDDTISVDTSATRIYFGGGYRTKYGDVTGGLQKTYGAGDTVINPYIRYSLKF